MKMLLNDKLNQQGFTLIEILLYLSLSVVMVSLIGGTGVSVMANLSSAKAEEELQYNSQFVSEKIRSMMQEAESIEIPERGSASTTLVLRSSEPARDPVVFSVQEGRLQVKEGDGPLKFLSGAGTEVSGHEFHNVSSSNGDGSVRLVLPMAVVNNSNVFKASTTLYTTVSLHYP
jgi:Tfp pilus assembly protein PilV